jgi:hypothetical protein
MKPRTLLFAAVVILISFCAQAQEAQYTVEEHSLTISIVGAASYNDIRLMQSNLKRSIQITRLATSLASKGLVELTGTYTGDKDSLVDEIRGLAQDRFSVAVSKQKRNDSEAPLTVTLRKLAAGAPQE